MGVHYSPILDLAPWYTPMSDYMRLQEENRRLQGEVDRLTAELAEMKAESTAAADVKAIKAAHDKEESASSRKKG